MTTRAANASSREGIGDLLLWTVKAGLLLVLVTPLLITPETLFPYVVGKALAIRTAIEITFALWLLLIIYYPRHRPAWSWVLAAFGLWLLVALIASYTGVSPTRSLWSNFERMQGVIDRAHWFAFILMAGAVFRTLPDWRLLFTVNLAVAALVSVLGMSQFYGAIDSQLLVDLYRVASTLGNPAYMGAYAMVNVLIGLGLIIQSFGRPREEVPEQVRPPGRMSRADRRRRARRGNRQFNYLPYLRVFWLLAAILCLWCLWLSGTRGAMAGLGVGAVVFVLGSVIYGRLRMARLAAYAIIAVGIIAIAFVLVARFTPALDPLVESSITLRRLTTAGLEERTIRGRLESLDAGIQGYQDRPVLGWGPENYLIPWGRYVVLSDIPEWFDQAHSKVFEELVTAGTVGLISYLLIWLALAAVVLRSARRRLPQDRLLVLAVGAALIAFFVQNLILFDSPVTVMQLSILMAFVVAEEVWLRSSAADPAPGQGRFASAGVAIAKARAVSTAIGNRIGTAWAGMPGRGGAARMLNAPLGVVVLTIVLAGLAGWLVFSYNAQSYTAARAAKASVSADSWPEAVAHFQESVDAFPLLSNFMRRDLITRTATEVETLTDAEFAQAVDLVGEIGPQALRVEPENWRLHVALATFYQHAAARDAQYLPDARRHVSEVVRLGPNTRPVANLLENMERLEGN